MLKGLGLETGIDLQALVDAGRYISAALKRPSGSRVANALAGQSEGEKSCA
jgi:hydroxymethylglutaryl-CoA lyase